jgi:hypothetical protein
MSWVFLKLEKNLSIEDYNLTKNKEFGSWGI